MDQEIFRNVLAIQTFSYWHNKKAANFIWLLSMYQRILRTIKSNFADTSFNSNLCKQEFIEVKIEYPKSAFTVTLTGFGQSNKRNLTFVQLKHTQLVFLDHHQMDQE